MIPVVAIYVVVVSVVAIHVVVVSVVAIPVVVIPVVVKALAEIEEALSARSAQRKRRIDRRGVPSLRCARQASRRSMRSSQPEVCPVRVAEIEEEFPV